MLGNSQCEWRVRAEPLRHAEVVGVGVAQEEPWAGEVG